MIADAPGVLDVAPQPAILLGVVGIVEVAEDEREAGRRSRAPVDLAVQLQGEVAEDGAQVRGRYHRVVLILGDSLPDAALGLWAEVGRLVVGVLDALRSSLEGRSILEVTFDERGQLERDVEERGVESGAGAHATGI